MKTKTQVSVLVERLRGTKDAMELQAKEYERRLEELKQSMDEQLKRNSELEIWRRSIDEWRWKAIGAGLAGAGIFEFLIRFFLKG